MTTTENYLTREESLHQLKGKQRNIRNQRRYDPNASWKFRKRVLCDNLHSQKDNEKKGYKFFRKHHNDISSYKSMWGKAKNIFLEELLEPWINYLLLYIKLPPNFLRFSPLQFLWVRNLSLSGVHGLRLLYMSSQMESSKGLIRVGGSAFMVALTWLARCY